jgi:membrane protein implicated in regulation of membrane protease activity
VTEPAIWAVVGLALGALEMLAPGFFLLWIGLGAIATGAATVLFGLGWHAQIGVFIVLTAVLVGAVGVRMRRRAQPDLVNAPSAGLIGQTCRAIDFQDGQGRVALGDGTWSARLQGGMRYGDAQPANGTPLKVVGLEGTTLLVAANG